MKLPGQQSLKVPHRIGQTPRLLHDGQKRVHRNQVQQSPSPRRHRLNNLPSRLRSRGENGIRGLPQSLLHRHRKRNEGNLLVQSHVVSV